jgi:hypothetical protein
MYKYALRMLAGANPREVIASMPEKDYRRLSEFMSEANNALPRRQRRMMNQELAKSERKRRSHRKV